MSFAQVELEPWRNVFPRFSFDEVCSHNCVRSFVIYALRQGGDFDSVLSRVDLVFQRKARCHHVHFFFHWDVGPQE